MTSFITSRRTTANVQDEAPKALVWNVRMGTTGSGVHAFDVYTTDMGEARIAAENVIRHLPATFAVMFGGGFTVHAVRPTHKRTRTLARNPFLTQTGAIDFSG